MLRLRRFRSATGSLRPSRLTIVPQLWSEDRKFSVKPEAPGRSSKGSFGDSLGIAKDILGSKGGSADGSAGPSNRESLKKVFAQLKPETKTLSLALATLGVTTGISLVFPAAIGNILDLAMDPNATVTPASIVIGLFGMFTVQTIFMGIRTSMLANMGERISARIRK